MFICEEKTLTVDSSRKLKQIVLINEFKCFDKFNLGEKIQHKQKIDVYSAKGALKKYLLTGKMSIYEIGYFIKKSNPVDQPKKRFFWQFSQFSIKLA